MAVVDFAPIVERDAAVDALLDARRELAAVQFSTLPGLPLYEAMRQAIAHVDAAISELRRKSSTTTPPSQRTGHRAGVVAKPVGDQAAVRAVLAGPPSYGPGGLCGICETPWDDCECVEPFDDWGGS